MKQPVQYLQYYYKTIALLLLMMAGTAVKAQKKESNHPDTLADKLSNSLSVNKEKAKSIQAAMNYHHDEIFRLMNDSTLKPEAKRERLKKLMEDRRQKMNAAMSPAEKDKLKQYQMNRLKKEAERQASLEQQHEAEMNRISHKRILKPTKGDTIKTTKKAQ